MKISTRTEPFEMQQYSLTGDLLSYLRCGLQYRFYNMGSLPPSAPVQQWFGEFIHGVMEEGYLKYVNGLLNIKEITFDDVQEIAVSVADRLEAKGLKSNRNDFLREDRPDKKCCEMIANKRAFESMRVWAPHLYPLIEGNEVPLEGTRPMPETPLGKRSDRYSVTGVADVISAIKVSEIDVKNRIHQYLIENDYIKDCIDQYEEFEIITDYKGTHRPNLGDKEWKYHDWQIRTYMWLRQQQLVSEGKDYPVIGGFLLYLNELCPSDKFLSEFPQVIAEGATDVVPTDIDLALVKAGKPGRERFLTRRCFRLITYDEEEQKKALDSFDAVVCEIETNVQSEMRDSKNVMKHWNGNFREETCTACDVKTFCPFVNGRFGPTVP